MEDTAEKTKEAIMDNIEKVEWAKNCIENLANGIQPFTGEMLENSVLDDPQLIRCFFFVRDLLNDIVASGGKRKPKAQFVLTDEVLENIQVKEEKMCLTRFLNGIKEINGGKAPKFGAIRDYLVSQEILEIVKDTNGKNTSLATTKAKQYGIENEERNGSSGRYTVVVYDENGQKYLIECLRKIYG